MNLELSAVQDIIRVDKSLTPKERKRLGKYKGNLDAYEGYHFEQKPTEYDPETGEAILTDEAEVTLNFVRRFVDKLVRFTLGNVGFGIDVANQENKHIQEYLDDIWDKNNRKLTATSTLKWGSILGDSYLIIEPSKRLLSEKLLDGTTAKRLKDSLTFTELLEPDFILKTIPATNGFPYYAEDKKSPFAEMIMFEYKEVREKPQEKVVKEYKGKSPQERHILRFADYLDKRSGKKPEDETEDVNTYLYRKIYYSDRIEEWNGNTKIATYKVDFGIVPVIHIPNKIKSSNTPFGDDDITDIIPLNYELNYKASDVSEIINYYQSPLTLFFGVGLETIEKGSDRMLTGLPENAKVQNLEMKGDLGNSQSYIDFLKGSMLEIFGLTPTALTGSSGISNTSGVALHMQYEPLMERKQEKDTYVMGFQRANMLIIYFGIKMGTIKEVGTNDPIEALRKDPKIFETIVNFPNTLPKDDLMVLQKHNTRIASGLGTREDALRELGETNPARKLAEIEADQLAVAKFDLVRNLIANIAEDGVDATGFKQYLDDFSKTSKEGTVEKNFATGMLNDPMLHALINMNAKNVDLKKKQELEISTGTPEIKKARGKVQSIVKSK